MNQPLTVSTVQTRNIIITSLTGSSNSTIKLLQEDTNFTAKPKVIPKTIKDDLRYAMSRNDAILAPCAPNNMADFTARRQRVPLLGTSLKTQSQH